MKNNEIVNNNIENNDKSFINNSISPLRFTDLDAVLG